MDVGHMNGETNTMKVEQVLHMNGGDGETSYAKNSASQNKLISMAKPIIEEATLDLFRNTVRNSISIADLGSSAGPNTLLVVSEIMNIIGQKCRQLDQSSLEFQVFLNDLPGNDFNTIFKSLPTFHEKLREEKGQKLGRCFFAGVPGSFYGRLFPRKSIHLVHSSSSLHWLSQVPPELTDHENSTLNKGKIYISKTSPPAVLNAYASQFQRDFSLFLKSRSEEIVPGGRMVLMFRGRRIADPSTDESCFLWELLAQALKDLVAQDLIEEKNVDSFNAPYYDPSPEEIKSEIQKEGSFILVHFETVVIEWNGITAKGNGYDDTLTITMAMVKAIRAIVEPILQNHFGKEIMDPLFQRIGEIMGSTTEGIKHIVFVMSLVRNV